MFLPPSPCLSLLLLLSLLPLCLADIHPSGAPYHPSQREIAAVSGFKGVWALSVVQSKLYLVVSLPSTEHLGEPEKILEPYKKFWLYSLQATALDESKGTLLLAGATPTPLINAWMFNSTFTYVHYSDLFLVNWPMGTAALVNFWFVRTPETRFTEAYLTVSFCETDGLGWANPQMVQLNVSLPRAKAGPSLVYKASLTVSKVNETWLSTAEPNAVYAIGRAQPRLSRYTLTWADDPRTPKGAIATHGVYWICRRSTLPTDQTLFLSAAVCPLVAVDWDILSGFVSQTTFYLLSRDRRVFAFPKGLFLQYNPQTRAAFTVKTFDEFFWNKAPTKTSVKPVNVTVTGTSAKPGLGLIPITHYTVLGVFGLSFLALVSCALYVFACDGDVGESTSKRTKDPPKAYPGVSQSKPSQANESKAKQLSDAQLGPQSSTKRQAGSLTKESEPKKAKKSKVSPKPKQLVGDSKRKRSRSSRKTRNSSKRSKKSKKSRKRSKGKGKSKKGKVSKSTAKKKEESSGKTHINQADRSLASSVPPMETRTAKRAPPLGSFNVSTGQTSPLLAALLADKSKKAAKTKLKTLSTDASNDVPSAALKVTNAQTNSLKLSKDVIELSASTKGKGEKVWLQVKDGRSKKGANRKAGAKSVSSKKGPKGGKSGNSKKKPKSGKTASSKKGTAKKSKSNKKPNR